MFDTNEKGRPMTDRETESWISLIIAGVMIWILQDRMLDGWTLTPHDAGDLLTLYLWLIAVTIVAEIVLAIGAAILRGGRDAVADERDRLIQRRASLVEYYFFVVAINAVILVILGNAAYADVFVPRVDLLTAAALFFALMLMLYFGNVVKQLTAIALYRLG